MPGMDNENSCIDNKLSKSHCNDSTTEISNNLASFLKNLSQNSVSINDTHVTTISELNLDIDNFEHRNIQRSKSEANEFFDVKPESFLSQLANSERILNLDCINGKLSKSQSEMDINRSLQNVNLISRLTNAKFSNIDALNSMQLQNISVIKSLLENQNGQIYLLVKSNDTVQNVDSPNGFTNLLNPGNYPHHQIQYSPTDIAVHQLKLSNNISTTELIQKIFESPQSSTSSNNFESILNNGKIDETSISSLVQTYRDSLNSDSINNYYECSLDSNNDEPEITLLVNDDNSISANSQFPISNHNQSIKEEKQILILKRHSELDLLPTIGRIVSEQEKEQLSLFSDQNSTAETNSDMFNDVANNLLQMSSSIFRKTHSNNKSQKKSKNKQSKVVNESQDQSEFKTYPSNSTIYSSKMSTCQIESKDNVTSDDEFKELKRKSSHNEVERRRRDRINTWINELQNMLPASEKVSMNRSKSHILKSVYDYFRIQTNQFNEIQAKYEKICAENREKSSMIKTLEAEKEVLLNQLQYINQAVTNTVKSTQQSLNRANVNHYHDNCSEKIKVNQPYRITNLYSNSDVNNSSNTYLIDDNQIKKRKLNPNNTS